jgi:hypothetical protein
MLKFHGGIILDPRAGWKHPSLGLIPFVTDG